MDKTDDILEKLLKSAREAAEIHDLYKNLMRRDPSKEICPPSEFCENCRYIKRAGLDEPCRKCFEKKIREIVSDKLKNHLTKY